MGSIRHLQAKIKQFRDHVPESAYVGCIIVFVGVTSFGLGRISADVGATQPVTAYFQVATTAMPAQTPGGVLVGSQFSDIYHYPWCSGAQRIDSTNEVWFSSVSKAQNAGYKPAANCPGLTP